MIMRANSGSSFLDLIEISRDALIATAVPRISGISQGRVGSLWNTAFDRVPKRGRNLPRVNVQSQNGSFSPFWVKI